MTTTLREILTELGRDPAVRAEFGDDPEGFVAACGFELSTELLGEAIVAVAAGLPPAAAEHLAPFTISHGPIPPVDPSVEGPAPIDGLELLATGPIPGEGADAGDVDDEGDTAVLDGAFGEGTTDVGAVDPHPAAGDDGFDPAVDERGAGLESPAAGGFDDPTGLDELMTEPAEHPTFDEALDARIIEADDPGDLDGLE